MLFSKPLSTMGTGVAYSCGYNFRSSITALSTRSSSSSRNVLIQVIALSFSCRWLVERPALSACPSCRGTLFHRRRFGARRSLFCCRLRFERYTDMLVDRLALVIVLGMCLAVSAGQRLRGLIGFESQVAILMLGGHLFVAQPGVAQHQVVVGLQIFGIDRQRLLKFLHRIRVTFLKKIDASQFVVHHAIARKLRQHALQRFCRFVVLTFFLQYARVEEIRARQSRLQR